MEGTAFSSFENLRGGSGNDNLTGSTHVDNVMWGGDGNDTINTNYGDTAYDTGLAFTGIQLDGTIIDPPGGVPEPATWAMFIAGFGLVGAAARRRRADRASA